MKEDFKEYDVIIFTEKSLKTKLIIEELKVANIKCLIAIKTQEEKIFYKDYKCIFTNKNTLQDIIKMGKFVYNISSFDQNYFNWEIIEACISTKTHYIDSVISPENIYKTCTNYHKISKKEGIFITQSLNLKTILSDIFSFYLYRSLGKDDITVIFKGDDFLKRYLYEHFLICLGNLKPFNYRHCPFKQLNLGEEEPLLLKNMSGDNYILRRSSGFMHASQRYKSTTYYEYPKGLKYKYLFKILYFFSLIMLILPLNLKQIIVKYFMPNKPENVEIFFIGSNKDSKEIKELKVQTEGSLDYIEVKIILEFFLLLLKNYNSYTLGVQGYSSLLNNINFVSILKSKIKGVDFIVNKREK